jgi:putative intracellular protease/amidase
MTSELRGKTVAFLVANEGVEEVELTEPWKAVAAAGGTPRLVSVEAGEVQAFNHLDRVSASRSMRPLTLRTPTDSMRSSCRAAWRIRTTSALVQRLSRSRSHLSNRASR